MAGLLAIVALGFFLGMRHATDPDHVIAVSTIISREGTVKRATLIGAAWGAGHTLTIVLVGFAIIAFRVVLPPRLGLSMELAVAIMLILLGLRNLRGLLTWSAQPTVGEPVAAPDHGVHYHAHGEYVHAHSHPGAAQHLHNPAQTPLSTVDGWFRGSEMYQWLRPLIIGIVHGLAGSAAIALLVLSTITSVRWAIAYLVVFGLGTVVGMMLITLSMGSTFLYAQKRFSSVGRHVGWVAGAISVAFGIFIAYQIGFVDGLFRAHAHWIPR